MSLNSDLPEVVIPDLGFGEHLLSELKKQDENKVALIDGSNDGKSMTCGQIRDLSINCAKALKSLELAKDDVIATCFSNCLEFPSLVVGAALCRIVVCTCNPNYTQDEMIKQFSGSKPKAVFIDGKDYAKVKNVQKQVPSIKYIFAMDQNSNTKSFSEFIFNAKKTAEYSLGKPNPSEDIGMILYSSGTTGLPKGVMLTHKCLVAYGEIMKIGFSNHRNDVIYSVTPMFHILGGLVSFVAITQGCKIVVDKRFELENFFKAVQKYKVTHLSAVPPMLLAICNSPLLSQYDTSSLKVVRSGAAPLAAGVAHEIQRRLNVRICQGWGLTEGLFTTGEADPYTPITSVGKPLSNTQIKIVDVVTNKILGPYEDGEILAKNPLMMKGYYKNPEATARTIDSKGWLHTGDIGHYDQHGYIYIVDRLKELIKYKGFQVAPAELEELLLRHPQILDAAVIGIPDAEAGEVPKAFIVRKNDSLTIDDIHLYVKGKVSSYKYLRGGISFQQFIPKSPSGKILRKDLRAQEKKSKL